MGLKIDGIAASQAIDTSAESIDIDGLDISSLEAGDGTFNYEHRHPKDPGGSALDVLGAITYAKKIMKEDDCSTDRERLYWDQVELPFVYIQGELFNDEEDNHVAAQAMAAAIQFYTRRKLPCVVRLSIDGHTLERDPKNPNVLKRALARDVAITYKPANHSCRIARVDHIKDAKAELEKRTDADDPSYYTNSGTYRFPSVTFSMMPFDDDEPVEIIKSELEVLYKAMFAGNGNVAPSSLTGGAAIQKEDISSKRQFVNMVKGAFRDWNGVSSLKEHMKKRVPEATDSFLEKFADLVDTIHLRKAVELDQHLHQVMKSSLDNAITKLPKFQVEPHRNMQAESTPELTGNKTKNIKIGANPSLATPQSTAGKHMQAMQAEGLNIEKNPSGWNVNFQNQGKSANPDLIGTNPVLKPKSLGIMQSVVSKFFPQKPLESVQSFNPTVESMAEHKRLKDVHMNKMTNEGWNFSKEPNGNWTATPPLKKNDFEMATVRGRFIEPTAVKNPFFDDMDGKLYLPEGVFSTHIPSRDEQSGPAFQSVMQSPALTAFHERAMDGWKMVNERLHEGTLPEQILKIGSWLMQKQLNVPDSLKQWVGSMNDLNLKHTFELDPFQAMKEMIAKHRASGKDLLQDQANGGQMALSPRNARLGLNALGCGDVMFSDDNLIRSLFGLDYGQDQVALDAIKRATNEEHVWNDIEKYYGTYHDAINNVKDGSQKDHFTVHPKDVLFPSAMKHWLAISAHDQVRGMTEAPGFDAQPVNPHTKLMKTEALSDVRGLIDIMNSWLVKYGPMMMLMMYFSMLVPRILAQNTSITPSDPNGGLQQ